MKWMTLDYVKAHSRIDFDCDDRLLELYVDSAEEALLHYTRRSFEEIVAKWGTSPRRWYTPRSCSSTTATLNAAPPMRA